MTTLDRRSFLSFLGITTVGLLVPGCAAPADDGSESTSSDLFSAKHRKATIAQMMEVMLPGAVAAGGPDVLAVATFLPAAITIGLVPPLPPEWASRLHDLDALLQEIVVDDLDEGVFFGGYGDIGDQFVDLSEKDKIDVLADRLDNSALAPLYEMVRAGAMLAFLTAPINDNGYAFIGIGRYENFADDLHSSGFRDYSYDDVPTFGDRTLWTETVEGDIP